MKRLAVCFAPLLALGLLSACGPEATAPAVTITYTPPVVDAPDAPAAPAGGDSKLCEQIEAQKSINGRLSSDGYADSYSSEYDQLLQASGC